MGKPLRVLVIDNSLDNVDMVLSELRRSGYEPVFERVDTSSALEKALKTYGWDIILSGHSMPLFSGMDALVQLQSAKLDVPFIVMSDDMSMDTIVRYMRAGAHDYVGKDNPVQLVAAIERALHEMEERLQECQKEELLCIKNCKYRLLIENLSQRVFYKDKNSVYVFCNESLARDLHIKPEEIFGKTDFDLYPEELAGAYRIDDKRIMESGQAEEKEEKYIRDCLEFIIRTVKTPVRDEQGNIIGIMGIFWDITEKIMREREEIERYRHLASLGELAAGVAHEINNPINGIINYAQMLFNKSSEGSMERDLADRVIKEGDRIANMVNKILSFAIPSDKKEKKSVVNIYEVMSDTLFLTKAQLKRDNVRVDLKIPIDLSKILVYPQQVQRVFLNAISNARYSLNQKYPDVHENKILEILGEETIIDNCLYVRITFYDHGIGMPADIKDRVTDTFFTIKQKNRGSELGLRVSHDIISSHGGKITIDSVEGRFTKFSVLLPVKPIETA